MDGLVLIAKSIYNYILISIFDYDNYYNDLLKNALKYGMTRNDFWYGEDYKEYFLYEEAYYERLHEESHIQGYYNYIALSTIISNIFSKKGSQQVEYPSMNNLSLQKEKSFVGAKKDLTAMSKTKREEYYYKKLAQCY